MDYNAAVCSGGEIGTFSLCLRGITAPQSSKVNHRLAVLVFVTTRVFLARWGTIVEFGNCYQHQWIYIQKITDGIFKYMIAEVICMQLSVLRYSQQ